MAVQPLLSWTFVLGHELLPIFSSPADGSVRLKRSICVWYMNPSAPVRSGLELTKLQVNRKSSARSSTSDETHSQRRYWRKSAHTTYCWRGSKRQLAQPKSPAKVFGPFLRNAKPSGPPTLSLEIIHNHRPFFSLLSIVTQLWTTLISFRLSADPGCLPVYISAVQLQ